MSTHSKTDNSSKPDVTFLRGILVVMISGTVLAGSLCGTLAYRQTTDNQNQVVALAEP